MHVIDIHPRGRGRLAVQTLILSGVAAILATPSISMQADEPWNSARKRLHEAIASGNIAGAAHLVVQQGETRYLEVVGMRDIDDQEPFQADTLLRIYSMTKPITSVAAMTLYEQGKFNLDDPVADFIPAFREAKVFEKDGESFRLVDPKRPITVRDVFTHTTGYSYGPAGGNSEVARHYREQGLRYHGPADMFPPKMTIEEAAVAMARIPALHHPGERFTYGFSTDLLGRLVEIWSGQPLDEYLRESLFEPLEMHDTGFAIPESKRDRFASCHTTRDGNLAILDKAETSPFAEGFEFLSGGGGLISTLHDYAKFCQMMVDGGQFNERRILKPSTVELVFTDQLKGSSGDFQFGLGFAIAEVTIGSGDKEHQAKQVSWGGYASTDFRLVPEEKLFQIVMRQHIPSAHKLAGELIGIIYGGLEPLGQEAQPADAGEASGSDPDSDKPGSAAY